MLGRQQGIKETDEQVLARFLAEDFLEAEVGEQIDVNVLHSTAHGTVDGDSVARPCMRQAQQREGGNPVCFVAAGCRDHTTHIASGPVSSDRPTVGFSIW